MAHREPVRPAARRNGSTALAVLVVVCVALVAVIAHRTSAPPSSESPPPSASSVAVRIDVPPGRLPRGSSGLAGGAVPDGVTVFDDDVPAVANLDPDLLGALRRAATDAAADGVDVVVSSGWRSPEYQERLLREAVAKYGSLEAAARWVATPTTSAHVSGDAVDIGPSDAMAWLSEHGAGYGLCRIYGNEPWHFELRPAAVSAGCPAMYADPTQDPRMRAG